MFAAIRRASSPRAAAKKKPQQVSAGASFWVAKGDQIPNAKYSLGDLCEDSVAQRRQEVGLLRAMHNEAGGRFLDSPRRREAALISTSDGKRIITQLSFNIPNLATIRS
jgi:hypothetical protein